MAGAAGIGQTLTDNRGNLDKTMKDAADIAEKLDRSAGKIDGLMASVQGFVGSPDTKGPISEVGDAAKSIKALADELNVRIKQISPGLVHFSGSGLKEYEDMASDARKAINDVDHMVHSIEKNPSQLLFGAK